MLPKTVVRGSNLPVLAGRCRRWMGKGMGKAPTATHPGAPPGTSTTHPRGHSVRSVTNPPPPPPPPPGGPQHPYSPTPPAYGAPPPGPPPKKDKANRVVLIGLGVGVGLIALLCGVGGIIVATAPTTSTTKAPPAAGGPDEPAPAAPPPETEAPTPTEPPKPTIPGTGTLIVGKDILPGRYRGNVAGGGCYWSRLSSFEGSGIDGIIANDNISGPTVVEIAPTDVGFKTSRCGEWSPADTPLDLPGRAPAGDGVFVVGLDIDPGTYRSNNTGSCYWARLRSFAQDGTDSIIGNDNSRGPAIVTIAPGDVGFKSSRCNSWERIQ